MSAFAIKKITSPLPMSLATHVVAFIALAGFASFYGLQDDVINEAVIELASPQEITIEEALERAKENPPEPVEELPDREVDPAFAMFMPAPVAEAQPTIMEKIAETIVEPQPQPVEPPKPEMEKAVPSVDPANLAKPQQAGAAGTQAPLAATEAVKGGDGVPAAGAGNPNLAVGGASGTAGLTGTGNGSAQDGEGLAVGTGATEGDGTGTSAGTESIDDIAERFAALVDANKKYPYMALRRNQTGVVYVYASLSAGGDLQDCGVSSSSGVSSLDNAAVAAVENSCPFSHGAGHDITITVPIHFELN